MFLAIASFYALFLSFIVLVVWDQLNETRGNVSKEGSSAMGLYRDIKFYPDSVESKRLMIVYLDFVYNVIDEEFPNMEHMKASRKTPESLNAVYFKMERLDPKTPFQVQLVAEMFNHLNELATYRGLRTTSMETEISPPMWLPMILGALITILCAMLLDVESNKLHIALNSMLGTFIGIFLFTIILLDHPFSGEQGIKPKSYREIFTMEHWVNQSKANTTTTINQHDNVQ
ncbi:MAG: DUF4239 domain-containing protein [Bacteroidetes bacterium]|nr:DUF4239 domain-containing protein [Bacteroidota bacterium]